MMHALSPRLTERSIRTTLETEGDGGGCRMEFMQVGKCFSDNLLRPLCHANGNRPFSQGGDA